MIKIPNFYEPSPLQNQKGEENNGCVYKNGRLVLPHIGNESNTLTKEMTAANRKKKQDCIKADPKKKAAKEKRFKEEQKTGAFEDSKKAKKQIAKENGKN